MGMNETAYAQANEPRQNVSGVVIEARDEVAKLHARLREITNRLCGQVPEQVAKTRDDSAEPGGNVALGIRRESGRIVDMVQSMHEMLARIEGEF